MNLNKSERDTIINSIIQNIQFQYVLPEVGERVCKKLVAMQDKAADNINDPHTFMRELNAILAEASGDEHLRLLYDPERAQGKNHDEVMAQHFERARRNNFGFVEAQRLAGNIGYLNIQELPPPEVAREIIEGMFAMIAHTNAVIMDLRANTGGTPGMVQLIVSYFVDEAPRPLSGIFSRVDKTAKVFKTLPEVTGQRMTDVPLYVLVSGATFSGGEALAYDLQALKRATLFGENTRGGAHLASMLPIANTYLLRLPTARALNPLTEDNWEGIGVQPDIKCAAHEALNSAHRTAIEALLKNARTRADMQFYEWELATLRARQNPPRINPSQWQTCVGQYNEWEISVHGDNLMAKHHTCYKLAPLSQSTYIVDDTRRLRFDADTVTVQYRDGGQEIFERE